MRRRWALPAVAVVALVATVVAAAGLECAPASASSMRARRSSAAGLRCATSSHPDPVVLVPGTFEATSWTAIRPALAAGGYCVAMFNYVTAGIGPIEQSASELGRFVDAVLNSTRAKRVSIVAHSQGGVVARYYIKFLGGTRTVDDLVALAPSNHGTITPLVIPGAAAGCVACAQQTAGSEVLDRLNATDGTPGPVDYTVVETRADNVVIPYQSAFLHGPRERITNVLLQGACPDDPAGHLTITDDPVAVQWVEQALGRNGPAGPAFRPRC
jgi:triacylglycerol lipase